MCSAAVSDAPPSPRSTIEQALALIDAQGPQQLATDALHRDVEWFTALQRSLEARTARWLAEIQRRERRPSADPLQPSASRLLQDRLHLSSNAAHAQLRTARQLEHLPSTAAAYARGEIGAQQVAVICRALDEVHDTCLEPGHVEAELLQAARHMDDNQLRQHWLQLRYQADREAGLQAEQEQRHRRWLRLWKTRFDTYRLEGELDPESGATLKTALRGLLGPRAKDDERSHEQRRADALTELARRRLDAGDLPRRGGEKPHLMVVAELSTLRLEPGSRLAQLNWGPLLTGQSARRLGCDAALTPVLVGARGETLHVGRRVRAVSPRLRRALNLRDRHCQEPGCTVPADECQPHHKRHWADGGRTDMANCELYCDRHHRDRHPENDRFRRRPPP
jgi:hypothetical protein